MLEVLDTAGQEEYTALRDQWIRDGEGFLIVYSICSRISFIRAELFHRQIARVKSQHRFPGPTPRQGSALDTRLPPTMLVGHQCDRVTEREVSTQEGAALAKKLGCLFVEASAKNCINVETAFYDVVRVIRQQRKDERESSRGVPTIRKRT